MPGRGVRRRDVTDRHGQGVRTRQGEANGGVVARKPGEDVRRGPRAARVEQVERRLGQEGHNQRAVGEQDRVLDKGVSRELMKQLDGWAGSSRRRKAEKRRGQTNAQRDKGLGSEIHVARLTHMLGTAAEGEC